MPEPLLPFEPREKPPGLFIDWFAANGTPEQKQQLITSADIHLARLEARTKGASKLTHGQRVGLITARLGMPTAKGQIPQVITRDSYISTFRDADASLAFAAVETGIISEAEAMAMLRDTFDFREKQWYAKVADLNAESARYQAILGIPAVAIRLQKMPHFLAVLSEYAYRLTVEPLVVETQQKLESKGFTGLDVAVESLPNLNNHLKDFLTVPQPSIASAATLAERLVLARYLTDRTDYANAPADAKLLWAIHSVFANKLSDSADGVIKSTIGRSRSFFRTLLVNMYNRREMPRYYFFDEQGNGGAAIRVPDNISPERTYRVMANSQAAALPVFKELAMHVLQGKKLNAFAYVNQLKHSYQPSIVATWPATLHKLLINVLTSPSGSPDYAVIAQDQLQMLRELKEAIMSTQQ